MFLFVSAIEKTYSYTCDITLNTDLLIIILMYMKLIKYVLIYFIKLRE